MSLRIGLGLKKIGMQFAKTHGVDTGKSFSEALILASTNPQYDKRLFVDLPVQCMKTASSEHVVYLHKLFFSFCNNHICHPRLFLTFITSKFSQRIENHQARDRLSKEQLRMTIFLCWTILILTTLP